VPLGHNASLGSARFATAALTLVALLAFAANSLLTRLALAPRMDSGTLAPGSIDAATFTAVRLGAGAFVLCAIAVWQSRGWQVLRDSGGSAGGWIGPVALFAYAAPFTYAYLRIGAAVGALLLFGSVQVTMIGWGIFAGERPRWLVWFGLLLAIGGLGFLLLPSAVRPDLVGALLMVVAGLAWGVYSLRGRRAPHPLASNARSFLLALPFALTLLWLDRRAITTSASGLWLAAISGGVTSGLGYAAWYRALPHLTATNAAIVQLSVPIVAALGAVVVLNETPTARLIVASAIVLGGVALAIAGRRSVPRR
jgi:drug/metabolite transporter (DMT)-like permease